MKNVPASPLAHHLRLPLVFIAGLLCMGSGLGNPGCGSGGGGGDLATCTSGCAVEGSYTLTFEDPSPLSPGCQELGLSLPTGPLVITRDDRVLSMRLNGVDISGSHYGGTGVTWTLKGNGAARNPSGVNNVPISVMVEGSFTAAPDSTSEPAAFKGRYEVFSTEKDYEFARCKGFRDFTATRP